MKTIKLASSSGGGRITILWFEKKMTTLEMISDLEKKYYSQLNDLQVLKAWEHIRLQGVDIDQIAQLQLTNMSKFELEIKYKIRGGNVYEYCIMKDGSRIKIKPVAFPK